ncbi:MAG: hypothetical protein KGN76_01250 [Acidobacteriota bacterium]|nr:hypothetical protein [Acidobacteriota bacterium]
MALFLITHELARPREEYAALWKRLSADQAVQVLASSWLVRSPRSAVQLLQDLSDLLDEHDRLMVVELSQAYAWRNPIADPAIA